MASVVVIGGGLAGSEAAWQASRFGVDVTLYEMRPVNTTPAHHTDLLAELVCSNSLRSSALTNAVGLLKEEMRIADSLIMSCAEKTAVPAGGALAVDRHRFAEAVTAAIMENPHIKLVREEISQIPDRRPLIIATGPLTSEAFSRSLGILTGEEYLSFFDAAAPLVTVDSLNFDIIFRQSRYGKGEAAYLNAPLNEEEYTVFREALISAEVNNPKAFEQNLFFEGCLPLEVLARRGFDTLRYGPLKPVGLVDPRTGKQPYAVVQMRQDNAEGTIYNMVGFQTQLKWGEQKRVFRMIPGLENAEFVRYGVMHRNTFLKGPQVLQPSLQMKKEPDILCAGQITGVEGYVESAASGLIAGINAALLALGKEPVIPPKETAHGALCWYVSTSVSPDFQPMNATFGLFPPLSRKLPKRNRIKAIVERALTSWSQFIRNII
ncbi:MAG: methylenetetrahydrofolate--tRNA-(uracil(54)-C(5))-methyltransferase (FADH(2)-oxidizing) TrmFO [Thermacetogeniaceae bacterium]|jgi:methylenetetrahydrofolate--tRNA-(uracil-5-)-methyltransferase|nr:methylenetetrahydrofolate--tRNA-(uracil(54)-C(5))-methyltransferase (FADH(2)-oxidizing) TrmFO [Thermoanaerobacterales bacterium]NLN21266.1 methylenetetrahydrofolate--tRNA-(uracil(54)-C(5))-methyltransferase (FADH(2)-oxidizing) TrmFO [Syntrophomonadaceae bacterium]